MKSSFACINYISAGNVGDRYMATKPQPKKGRKNLHILPLPIPICTPSSNQGGTTRWTFYSGTVDDQAVIVSHRGDAEAIHSRGSFGKWFVNKSDEKSNDDHLILTYVEAFFLSFALGCLFVFHQSKQISISEQWSLFCSRNKNFATKYAAYHHFRSKGWIPKEGLKFGTDFVLYRKSPACCHANYAVMIRKVKINNQIDSLKDMSWVTLAGIGRLASSVSKSLLICSVTEPQSENATPECLKHMTISEILFSRWTTSKEQEDERDVDTTF